MSKHSGDFRGLDFDNRNGEILATLQDEIDFLNKRLLFERDRNLSVQRLLRQARLSLIDLQLSQTRKDPNRLKHSNLLERVQIQWSAHKKLKKHIYISRSSLENSVFWIAQVKVRGIQGVMIDFRRRPEAATGPNWQILGIVSGSADPSEALAAVNEAALEHATCVMVEDGSELHGRSLKADSSSPRAAKARPLARRR